MELKTEGDIAIKPVPVPLKHPMTSYFQSLDLARFLSETPYKIWAQIQTPVFLSQLGGILITGLIASAP